MEPLGGYEAILSSIWGYAREFLLAAAIMAVTVTIAVAIRLVMRRQLQQRIPLHIYKPLENIIFYLVLLSGILSVLSLFGVSLSGLLVAGGIVGLVVGLASQQTISNLISGIFLLAEQPLRVGDPVTIEDVSGIVADVRVLSTIIRTWDGYIVRIPNSKVFEAKITNYQRTKARRVEFEIGISYKSSIDKAIEALTRAMEKHPFCLVNPGPQIFVDRYADSAVVLRVRCWAPPKVWFNTKIELQTMAKRILEEAGIEIPYPQLDVHIRDATELRVRLWGKGENQEAKQT